jgi:hypothetical protein
MGHLIYQWLDVLWLPVAWFVVHKNHRWMMMAFIICCGLTMRTQVELMESTRFSTGIFPFFEAPLLSRGLIGYGIIIAIFLILAHFSQSTSKMVFFAATISIYIFAFCLNMVVMLI